MPKVVAVEVRIIDEITSLHNDILGYYKRSLNNGIRIGELLLEQKKKLNHGEFTKWVDANLPFTDRTARNYMKVYNNRDKLKTETVSDLTTGYKLLIETKEIKSNGNLIKYINEQLEIQNNAAENRIWAERELGKRFKEITKLQKVVREATKISSEIDNRLQKNKEITTMLQNNEFNSEMKYFILNDLKKYNNQNAEWKQQIEELSKSVNM